MISKFQLREVDLKLHLFFHKLGKKNCRHHYEERPSLTWDVCFCRLGFKTNAHILIYSLASSDLLASLLMHLSFSVDLLQQNKSLSKLWIELCFFKEIVYFIAGMSNMLNYLLVTIDHYFLINHALKYKIIFTKKRVEFFVVGIWLFAMTLVCIITYLSPANQQVQ